MKRLLLLVFFCSAAHAEFYSANDLFNKMNGDHSDKMMALGYISGAADVMTRIDICPPQGVTLGQMSDVVRALIIERPEMRHYSADSFVRVALMKAFPCQKGRGA